MNSTATIQDTISDTAITTNRVKVNSPALLLLRPIGMKPGDGDQRPGQHRKGGGRVDVGGGLLQAIADLQPRHHHLDRDHCVVDQKAKGDDQRAERNTLQRNSGIRHDDEGDGEDQRDRNRDDQSCAKPEAEKADGQHDDHGLEQRLA